MTARPETPIFSARVAEEGLKEELFGTRAGGPEQTFQSLFCEHFHCAPAEYERRVFRKCLYWQARLLAPLLLRLKPDLFVEDFSFIQLVGKATSWHEVSSEAWRWRGGVQVPASFARTQCNIRVSGRKVVRLARELFQRAAGGGKHSPERARRSP